MNVNRTPEGVSTSELFQKEAAEDAAEVRQESATARSDALTDDAKNVTILAKTQSAKKTEKNNLKKVKEAMFGAGKAKALTKLQKLKDSAAQYHQNNPELEEEALLNAREYIEAGDSPEDILGKLDQFWKNDPVLQDEALDYLIENAPDDAAKDKLIAAKNLLVEKFSQREIIAGRNIGAVSRDVEYGGVHVAKSLRDYYQQITKEDHDANSLFRELSTGRSFEELNKMTDFLFHALGEDLKAPGPSIEPGRLHKLNSEVKDLQAVLGVYRFFQARDGLMEKMFAQEQLNMPPQINFEKMAKEFMTFTGDRYPSADKATQITTRMGISDEAAPAA